MSGNEQQPRVWGGRSWSTGSSRGGLNLRRQTSAQQGQQPQQSQAQQEGGGGVCGGDDDDQEQYEHQGGGRYGNRGGRGGRGEKGICPEGRGCTDPSLSHQYYFIHIEKDMPSVPVGATQKISSEDEMCCTQLQVLSNLNSRAPGAVSSRMGRLMTCIHKLSLFPDMVRSVKSVTDLLATEAEREEYIMNFVEYIETSLSSNPCEENPDDPISRMCPLHDQVRRDETLNSIQAADVIPTLMTMGWSARDCEALMRDVQLVHDCNIPLNDKAAVRAYTHINLHRQLNYAMRCGNHAPWRPFIATLSRGVQLLPLRPKDYVGDLVLYRGQSDCFGVNYAVGDTVWWPGFTSTSTSRHVAVEFCTSRLTKSLFVIRGINQERLGAAIRPLSFYPHEDEVLLVNNCKLTVRSVTDQVIGGFPGKEIELDFEGADGSPNEEPSLPQRREGTEHCVYCEIERNLSQEPIEPSSSALDRVLELLYSPPIVRSLMRHPHQGNQVMRTLQPHRTVTWLYVAAENGHSEVVRRLLTLHADPLFQEDRTGWTPLHAAVYRNRLDCAKVIVESSDRKAQEVMMRFQDRTLRPVLDELGPRDSITHGTRDTTGQGTRDTTVVQGQHNRLSS